MKLTRQSVRGRHFVQEPISLPLGLHHEISRSVVSLPSCDSRPDNYVDLFWTAFDPTSLYNTVFKIVFIGSSGYTIYLMLHDYKPTQDPNLDTFKVQYLLGAAAILAVLFPYTYTPSEVCGSTQGDSTFLADLSRSYGHFPSGSSR